MATKYEAGHTKYHYDVGIGLKFMEKKTCTKHIPQVHGYADARFGGVETCPIVRH